MAKETKISHDELGKAIARGMSEETARHERNVAKEAKRQESMLKNAADKAFNQNYS